MDRNCGRGLCGSRTSLSCLSHMFITRKSCILFLALCCLDLNAPYPSAAPYRILPNSPYKPIAPSISVRLLPITHGSISTSSGTSAYDSTAFFIRNDNTGQEFLFFGDVEPDSVSTMPRNRTVWAEAATKVAALTKTAEGAQQGDRRNPSPALSHIFLECSYRNGRRAEELFGHLSPPHVRDEMRTLAREVVVVRRGGMSPTANGVFSSLPTASPPPTSPGNGHPPTSGGAVGAMGALFNRTRLRRKSTISSSAPNLRSISTSFSHPSHPTLPPLPITIPDSELVGALNGVTLVIIHCKESMPPDDPVDDIRSLIRDEVAELLEPLELGLNVIVARQGMRMSASLISSLQ